MSSSTPSRRPPNVRPVRAKRGAALGPLAPPKWVAARPWVGIRPGVNLVRAAIGLGGLASVYLLFPLPPLFWSIVASAVALVVAAFLEIRRVLSRFRSLRVERALPNVIGRNLPFVVAWRLANDGLEPIHGELRDVAPAHAEPRFMVPPFRLEPQAGESQIAQSFRIPIRGRHTFGPLWIRLHGDLGLIEIQREIDSGNVIKVLPEKFASREELMKDEGAAQMLLDKNVRTRSFGVGTEFESLVEFREGDDPRRIDWRTTARLRHPVVRRFQIERHRDVMVVVDCGRLMGAETDRGTKLDCAIDAGLILARTALQSGDRCGFALYDDELRGYLPPVSGVPSLQALAETVYAAKSEFRESDFGPIFSALQLRQAKRSLLIVISDIVDVETSAQFRASLAQLSKRHVVLLAALRTPMLDRIVREPVETMLDGAKKAVTFRIVRERALVMQSLRHAGVFVLDIEPSKLTVPLVNRFVELRAKNLL
ncbi:MAG: DUF58 domain-containing protein [Planctomycetia bacterium]|nr:DUF58 domain-containing protein [Planctomycetia bacterium]